MSCSLKSMSLAAAVVFAVFAISWKTTTASSDGVREIAAFNQNYVALHLKMDTAGILALWAEDGVDLMPDEAPLIGRKAIGAWVAAIVAKMPGYKVVKQDMEFHDIQVSGDWASEWATEHQVVQPPDGKPVIAGYGKMALVLHRDADRNWKVKQEMWNAAPRP
jgi:uncharacterized protein (TIGR02246 family)